MRTTIKITLILLITVIGIFIESNCTIRCDDDVGNGKHPTVSVVEMQDSIKQLVLLTKLIQSESGSESFLDKLLVGSVVLNWMRTKNHTMDSVIFHPNRFSGVHGKGFRETEESRRAAVLLLTHGPLDTSIIFFLNPEISTDRSWRKKVMQRELVTRTKNHYFYK